MNNSILGIDVSKGVSSSYQYEDENDIGLTSYQKHHSGKSGKIQISQEHEKFESAGLYPSDSQSNVVKSSDIMERDSLSVDNIDGYNKELGDD